MSVTISVRIPDDMAEELADIADSIERSKSFLVQKALENYLQEQASLQISIDRLRDTSDPIISMEEMRKNIGL